MRRPLRKRRYGSLAVRLRLQRLRKIVVSRTGQEKQPCGQNGYRYLFFARFKNIPCTLVQALHKRVHSLIEKNFPRQSEFFSSERCGTSAGDDGASGGVVELVRAIMEPVEMLWNWWRR